MLFADATLTGVAEMEARIAGLHSLPGILHTLLLARAHDGQQRLARATPRRSGAAAGGWQVLPINGEQVVIVNRVVSKNGYSYPTGLITGTGGRAVATSGYIGGHNAAWHGMLPSQSLHAAWEREVRTGFSLPASLLRML